MQQQAKIKNKNNFRLLSFTTTTKIYSRIKQKQQKIGLNNTAVNRRLNDCQYI